MSTRAEQLPIEIWLLTFQYLEAHDLFHAFQNLNHYFNQILASNHLSFYVRLKEHDNNHLEFPTAPYWSDSVLNRIIYLRPFVQCQSDYFPRFLRWHANKLIRLQSLSIKICQQEISTICTALKELNLLEYLSLICTPNQILLKAILTLPKLRICQLILRRSSIDINHHLRVNSNIKQLFIGFLGNVNYSTINLLLLHMPKLKRLEIFGSHFSFSQVSIFAEQSFILPELRTLKLKLKNVHFLSDCFKCLHMVMPVLKHFYFNYNKYFLHEAFLDYFVSHWWPIIEQIEQINIYIKGHVTIDTINNTTETNLENNRQILLAKNKQSNGSFKIKWTEQTLIIFKLIEITIVKS